MDDQTGKVLAELSNGLWHATRPDLFDRILSDGEIKPEPDVPDKQRWGTGMGPEFYPYVRAIGGVSLFEFLDFDPAAYSEKYTASSWRNFVPCVRKWDCTVWIEIDREKVSRGYISGIDLFARRRSESSTRNFMPLIEAAHVGGIPAAAFKRAFAVNRDNEGMREMILPAAS